MCAQQTFEVHAEDSVVPHTPVLSEVKQLVGNMGQTIPSTPSEPSYIVPQLAESSLTAESLRASEGNSRIFSLIQKCYTSVHHFVCTALTCSYTIPW